MEVANTSNEDVAIETSNVTKCFGQLQVLHGVSMKFRRGEVTALIGDNGAGKSTFLKCLSGEHSPSGGTIKFDGRPVMLKSSMDARRLGLEMVYQDLALSPDIPVVENMFLGREIMAGGFAGKLGVVDKKEMRKETVEILRHYAGSSSSEVTGENQTKMARKCCQKQTKVMIQQELLRILRLIEAVYQMIQRPVERAWK